MSARSSRRLHIGRTTHVWEIQVTNPDGKLVSICRMTAAITDRKQD
jgi:1,4-dihydroxy-2-naphthoyl-CoA hydrolase